MMLPRSTFLVLPLVLVLGAGGAGAGNKAERLAYGCHDAVVDGAVSTADYFDQTGPDDPIGHGTFSGTLYVSSVLHGRLPSRRIAVRYFGHSAMVSAEMRFVVTPEGDYYDVRTVVRQGAPGYHLARRCDPALDR